MLQCTVVFTVISLALLPTCLPLPPVASEQPAQDVGDGVLGSQGMALPVCSEGEFLTTTPGGDFICDEPPVRVCSCPDLPQRPPPGCEQFQPPTRGAFVCLRQPATIYCSVMCDNSSEFSTTPLNPYFCGRESGSLWMDFTNQTHRHLPRCTGYRHRIEPLHDETFHYIPAPCGALTPSQITEVYNSFLDLLLLYGQCRNCEMEDIFLQCP